ncbi:hypothetical protein L1887_03485 [Cichorium endivia]|nr:hypothetical protein L1887_03485 [Cichorium endivia]
MRNYLPFGQDSRINFWGFLHHDICNPHIRWRNTHNRSSESSSYSLNNSLKKRTKKLITILVVLDRPRFEGNGDWPKVPPTISVMIFSLVYHDLAPVLCAYLAGDIKRIRTSIILGIVVPLVGLLVWNAITLGLSSQTDPLIDPVELLMR